MYGFSILQKNRKLRVNLSCNGSCLLHYRKKMFKFCSNDKCHPHNYLWAKPTGFWNHKSPKTAYWLTECSNAKAYWNYFHKNKFKQWRYAYVYSFFFFFRVFFIQCQLHNHRGKSPTAHTIQEEQEKYLREIFVAMEFQLITFYFLTKNSFI